jgi:hypothetical protein
MKAKIEKFLAQLILIIPIFILWIGSRIERFWRKVFK